MSSKSISKFEIICFLTFIHSILSWLKSTIFLPSKSKELLKSIPSAPIIYLMYSHMNCVGMYSMSESYLRIGFERSLLINLFNWILFVYSAKFPDPKNALATSVKSTISIQQFQYGAIDRLKSNLLSRILFDISIPVWCDW